jgi:hypothetical protein
MLPDQPVVPVKGRFSLPPDTESATDLCKKVSDHYHSNLMCAWASEEQKTAARDALQRVVNASILVIKVMRRTHGQ